MAPSYRIYHIIFNHIMKHAWSRFPVQGSNTCLLQWKYGVLTTWLPGNPSVEYKVLQPFLNCPVFVPFIKTGIVSAHIIPWCVYGSPATLSVVSSHNFLIFYNTDRLRIFQTFVFVPFSLIIPLQLSLSSCILLQAIRRTHITPSIFFLEISSAQYPISSFTVISTKH